MRPGALCRSALVYLHSDASMTDCWCSLNHREEHEPDGRSHSADIETLTEKENFIHTEFCQRITTNILKRLFSIHLNPEAATASSALKLLHAFMIIKIIYVFNKICHFG